RIARWAAAQAEIADPNETRQRVSRDTDPETEIAREVERLRVRDAARERYNAERARQRLMVNAERAVSGLAFLTDNADTATLWGRDQHVLWARGEGLMIVGPQGVGKSTVVQQLVLARLGLAAPEPELFGYPVVTDERPILYLAMDRPPQIRRSLARMVDTNDPAKAAVLRERLIVWTGPLPFDAAEAPDVFAEWVALHGRRPGMVVVDSLKDLASGLAKDDVGAGVNAAMQRVLADGTEFVSLHHQRKPAIGNPKPDKLADVYGNSWLTAGQGSIVLLWGEAGGATVELSHLKQPQERVGPLIVNHTRTTGTSAAADPTERLKEIARTAGIDGFTLPDAVRGLYNVGNGDDGWTALKSKTRRKLDKLTAEGYVTYDKGLPGGVGGGGKPAKWTYTLAERSTP
ncbi:AAA family ATPase, partial [Mycolicibacterium mageritense]|uniref:AAA family ATPase n=1 Tax=Mycolicibacterium mageritense TaxID=53462 RepID=UPI001E38BBA3